MLKTNTLLNRLNSPYYLEPLSSKRWLSCLKFSLFVFLFLLIFQPFGLNRLPEGIVIVALGYALTTFSIMGLLNLGVIPLFPVFFSEEKWNVQRELYWNLVNVLLIGFANALYSAFIEITPFNLYAVLVFELYTVTTALIPITVTVLAKEARLKGKFEKKSEEINTSIEEHRITLPVKEKEGMFVLSSENEKDKIELAISDFLFIQSSDNYVEVYFFEKQEVKKRLLRNSLKALVSDLEKYNMLFRCHKSYLVNLSTINHVSGNAQGYKLHLSGTDVLIPVSRQNNEELKKRLNK